MIWPQAQNSFISFQSMVLPKEPFMPECQLWLCYTFLLETNLPFQQASCANHVLGTPCDHSSDILTCLKTTVDGFSRKANLDLKTMFDLKAYFLFSFCPLSCTKYTSIICWAVCVLCVCGVWGLEKQFQLIDGEAKRLKGFALVWLFTDVIGKLIIDNVEELAKH